MKRITFLMLLLGGLLSGCNPKKDSVRALPGLTGANGILGSIIGSNGITNQCAQGLSNIGAIYDNGQTQGLGVAGSFQDRVVALLTATMLPQDVGTISSSINDSTGVRFTGVMALDANGNVIANRSKMMIQVYDSIWQQNRISNPSEQGIPLEFDPTQGAQISGQFNLTTGQGSLILKDQYGQIRFDGRIDAQYFSGTVSFQNLTNVTGSSPASGTLGQFTINSCGIVQR